MVQVQPMKYRCSECFAEPGHPCLNQVGKLKQGFHLSRLKMTKSIA